MRQSPDQSEANLCNDNEQPWKPPWVNLRHRKQTKKRSDKGGRIKPPWKNQNDEGHRDKKQSHPSKPPLASDRTKRKRIKDQGYTWKPPWLNQFWTELKPINQRWRLVSQIKGVNVPAFHNWTPHYIPLPDFDVKGLKIKLQESQKEIEVDKDELENDAL